MSAPRSTSRPCWRARTRSIPRPSPGLLEPRRVGAAAPAAAAAVPARRARRPDHRSSSSSPRRRASCGGASSDDRGRLRPRRVRRRLDPTLAAVARTLFARPDPLPDDDGALAPGARAEPADPASATASTKRSSSSEPSCARPRPRATPTTVERLLREVLDLQARRARPRSQARHETTVLTKRRNRHRPQRPQQPRRTR